MKVSDLIMALVEYQIKHGDNEISIPSASSVSSFSVEHDEATNQAEIWV